MAVAFDAVGPSASGTSGAASPLTWSHNPASGTALLVGVCLDEVTTATTCTATFNSVSMLALGNVNVDGGNDGFLYVFGLANVASGSQTVSVTFSSPTDVISAGSISFTGAALTNALAFGTFQSATGASTETLAFTTTSVNSQVCGFNASGGSDLTGMSAGTSRFLINEASGGYCGSCGGGTAPGTGGTVTLTWAGDTSSSFAVGGVEVLPSGAVRGGNVTTVRQAVKRAALW